MADTVVGSSYSASLSSKVIKNLGITGVTNPTVIVGPVTSISGNMTPSSTPYTSTKVWRATPALSSGTLTLDLTTLDDGNLPDIDLTSLSIKHFKIYNPAGNGTLTVAKGTTNGYFIFGATGSTIDIPSGCYVQFGVHNVTSAVDLSDVDSTHKTILFTGTGAQTFEIEIVA